MEKTKRLSRFTKITLGSGLMFLIYGFLSRMLPIYFFWESRSIWWGLILLGLIGLLIIGFKNRKKKNKTTIWNGIGIGIIGSILLSQIVLVIVIPNTDAYKASKEFILNDYDLKSEIGEITGFGLIPMGGISVSTNSNGKTGNANINLIIKGDRAFKSVKLLVLKDYGMDWEVHEVE